MPLIILGLLLLIGLLAYSIVRYMNSAEEDTRPVRERYPKAFQRIMKDEESDEDSEDSDEPIYAKGYVDTDNLRGDIDHMIRNLKDSISEKAKEHGIDLDKLGRDPSKHNPFSEDPDTGQEKDDSTIIFPTDNVEAEKTKRNIH